MEPEQSFAISLPVSSLELQGTSLNSSNGSAPRRNNEEKTKFESQKVPRSCLSEEHKYDSFKTWSGKLERLISKTLLGGCSDGETGEAMSPSEDVLPVARYFDALHGPELDTLRSSEEIMLPQDKKWPFLLRFPISTYGICLGVSSQAILWKSLVKTTQSDKDFKEIYLMVNLILWWISVGLILIVSSIYLSKMVLYFEAVRREYYHPVRVNFFFAPWISLLFLALGLPHSVISHLPLPLWYILMSPILCLELKIYGEWMWGGQRKLSKVANPTTHLSIVGNFIGSLLGSSMGVREGAMFFFSVGLAHYLVLFITLFQKLPTNKSLPRELHPVFFLFVAIPSVASMAWAKINNNGSFDFPSRLSYFLALFLYFSLVVRLNFFRGFKFSLAWWAYTFPMTGAAIATTRYSADVSNAVTRYLAVVLSAAASFAVSALLAATVLQASFLFPNDVAIAITRRRKPRKPSVAL